MAVVIQFRRDNAADWTAENPILAEGEIGAELDTDLFKIGNGITVWNELPYAQRGLKGDKGDKGDTGATGATGAASTIPGPKGDKGDQGDVGFTGNTGRPGADGYTPLKGVDYLDGAKGDPGDPGEDGRTVLSGSGAPAGDLGVTGDYYMDTAATRIYGPKNGANWGAGISLIGPKGDKGDMGEIGPAGEDSIVPGPKGDPGDKGDKGDQGDASTVPGPQGDQGPAGADGKAVLSGSGSPLNSIGIDGDFYIDIINDAIYGPKAGGVWGSSRSLIGPAGPKGDTGNTGPAGADSTVPGPKGDKGDTGSTASGIGITIDGGGVEITTGVKGYFAVPYACTITGWHITGSPNGSIVIDVWKRAGAIPSVAHRIAGTEKPTLSGAETNSDTTLTTWTAVEISAGDVIGYNVDSCTDCQWVSLVLVVSK